MAESRPPDPPELGRATLAVPMVIRACVEADLPALEWMGLFASHRAVIHDAFAAQRRGDGLMLLAVAGGFPVGQVWIDLAGGRAGGAARLWAVRTFPPLQGVGIGRHLMAAAERTLRDRGFARAELGVERANAGVRRFYERLGWRAAGRLHETVRIAAADGRLVEAPFDGWRMAKRLTDGPAPVPGRGRR